MNFTNFKAINGGFISSLAGDLEITMSDS